MIHLVVAPAGAGKTTYVLNQAREVAERWGPVRVVVANGRQAQAAQARLAQQGALGVRVHTMSSFARELLDLTGRPCVLLPDPVQIRVLRALVDRVPLDYYSPLTRTPGFIRLLRNLFAELIQAGVTPHAFQHAIHTLAPTPRLEDLARLYRGYHDLLSHHHWTDMAGLTTCARQALAHAPHVATDWALVAVDGFSRLSPADLALLQHLGSRVERLLITMTGDLTQTWHPSVARPWQEAVQRVQQTLHVQPTPLPHPHPPASGTWLNHLLQPGYQAPLPPGTVQALAAADEEGEVRAALRWLKQRILDLHLAPGDVALLARDLTPYQPILPAIAAEFGLPLHLVHGEPLRTNPAVDALMNLLNLLLPQPGEEEAFTPHDRRMPFRRVLAAWRSPYFRWYWPKPDLRITPQDADALAALARWARVVAGPAQWCEAFRRRVALSQASSGPENWREEDRAGQEAPRGRAARQLWRKWLYFYRSLTPPSGQQPVHVFVRWLENLIGQEPEQEEAHPTPGFTLNMVACIRAGDPSLVQRDIAALMALKEILRGMVWAAEAMNLGPRSFQDFVEDLGGALEAARYVPQQVAHGQGVLAGDVHALAGLRFRAVAVVGLAEGRFPATLHDDVLLRESTRAALRGAGLDLAPSPPQEEAALLYLALSRTDEHLLITRPRLAEGGATWQPSPYWHWVIQATGIEPLALTHDNVLDHAAPASWPELLLALARHPGLAQHEALFQQVDPQHLAHWQHGTQVVRARYRGGRHPFNGDLTSLAPRLARRFGPDHTWSARRLEAYLACPFSFFATHILGLEERPEPRLGLDARQLGNIYHRALEQVLRAGADQVHHGDALVRIWEALADDLLDEAPAREGFRPTAWWDHTRARIKAIVRRTLVALAQESQGWRPKAFEQPFGYGGNRALILQTRLGPLRLRGFIDRVDIREGGEIRIIDYKKGDVRPYQEKALEQGTHVQLPLYALAAEQALEQGRAVDGFYWSVEHAKASRLRLQKMGVSRAVAMAIQHTEHAVEGVRAGHFEPRPSQQACRFCPAAAFCWQAMGK